MFETLSWMLELAGAMLETLSWMLELAGAMLGTLSWMLEVTDAACRWARDGGQNSHRAWTREHRGLPHGTFA